MNEINIPFKIPVDIALKAKESILSEYNFENTNDDNLTENQFVVEVIRKEGLNKFLKETYKSYQKRKNSDAKVLIDQDTGKEFDDTTVE